MVGFLDSILESFFHLFLERARGGNVKEGSIAGNSLGSCVFTLVDPEFQIDSSDF